MKNKKEKNKAFRTIVAIFGAFNAIFGIFIPIAIMFLILSVDDLSQLNSFILIFVGIMSSMFRALKFWLK